MDVAEPVAFRHAGASAILVAGPQAISSERLVFLAYSKTTFSLSLFRSKLPGQKEVASSRPTSLPTFWNFHLRTTSCNIRAPIDSSTSRTHQSRNLGKRPIQTHERTTTAHPCKSQTHHKVTPIVTHSCTGTNTTNTPSRHSSATAQSTRWACLDRLLLHSCLCGL